MKVWRWVSSVVVVGIVALGVSAYDVQSTSKPEWKAFDPDEKGAFKPFWQTMETVTNQSMKVQGMEVNQKQTQTFYVKWTPTKKDKDKNIWTVDFKIVGVKMAIQIGGNEIAYDSTSKDPVPDNPLTQFFKTLKDAEFTYTIEKDEKEGMKVTKVAGLKPFVDRLAAANDQLKGLLENILNEEALKQMAAPMFAAFPRTEKEFTDAKWTNTANLNMGPIGSYKTEYTYTLNKGDTSKIEVTGAMTYKAPEGAAASSGLPFTIKEGNLKADNIGGSVTLDLKNGRILKSNIKMDLKGTLKIDIAGVETPVELTQNQTSSLETMDTEPAFLTAPATKK